MEFRWWALYHPAHRSGRLYVGSAAWAGQRQGGMGRLRASGSPRKGTAFLFMTRADTMRATISRPARHHFLQGLADGGPGSPWSSMPSDLASAVQTAAEEIRTFREEDRCRRSQSGGQCRSGLRERSRSVPALDSPFSGDRVCGDPDAVGLLRLSRAPRLYRGQPDDAYAYSSARRLCGPEPGPACRMVDGKSGHGVNMLDAEFTKTLLDWMKGLDGNRDRRPS